MYIKTLSNAEHTVEHQPFSTAMRRIPTSIFYVSTVTDSYTSVNINDRNAYELMTNLLNDYLLIWRNVTFILVDDVLDNAKSSKSLVFIFGFSFLISLLCLIGLWQLITRFIEDREKPVDLFLTIKKGKFEELKNASESFTSSIKPEDINITKFKHKNDYKQSLRISP